MSGNGACRTSLRPRPTFIYQPFANIAEPDGWASSTPTDCTFSMLILLGSRPPASCSHVGGVRRHSNTENCGHFIDRGCASHLSLIDPKRTRGFRVCLVNRCHCGLSTTSR